MQSKLTPEIADEIMADLSEGKSLRSICQREGMPSKSLVLLRCKEDPEFADRYARAREVGYDLMAEELLEISDETETRVKVKRKGDEEGEDAELELDSTAVQRNKLRIDTRKWLLSKMLPKKYGEKVEHDVSGHVDHNHTISFAKPKDG